MSYFYKFGSVLSLPAVLAHSETTRPVMRRLLCACLVAFAGAQLRPRRVGVNPMGEETGAAEAGGAEPDMADLMKNMMGGFAARSERSNSPATPPSTAPEPHPLASGCLWFRWARPAAWVPRQGCGVAASSA